MKTLLFDIETKPIKSWNWGIYEQNAIEVIEDWSILCFSWKWLDEKKAYVETIESQTEEQLVKKLHRLFDEADVIIAHNGNKFDIKKSNSKFLQYRLTPPSPYKKIDTLVVAKQNFKLTSNRLDDLGELLNVGRKVKHPGFEMWKGCMNGESKWWSLMKRYNRQDVVLLEKVYIALLPWVQNHPNYQWFMDEKGKHCCPNCGSESYQKRNLEKRLNYLIRRLHCTDCGKWFYGEKVKKV